MSPDLRWLALSFAAVILMPTRALSGTPGDSFDAPFVIEALPFVTTGSTCGYEDDTIYLCGSPVAAPDVVYRFVPDHDMTITLSTCGSSFRSGPKVYDSTRTPMICGYGPCLEGGYVDALALVGGSTYFIAIDSQDNYGTPELSCGEYVLSIEECAGACHPVYLRCPEEAIDENEDSCVPGYVDVFNGCGDATCHAMVLPCQSEVTVCGTNGRNPDGSLNSPYDLDTYEFTLSAPSEVTLTMSAGTATMEWQFSRLPGGNDPGEDLGYNRINNGEAFRGMLVPGRYWLRTWGYLRDHRPCGDEYLIRFSGLTCEPTPARRSSWGALKAIYR